MRRTRAPLLLAYYGDDFTGSTDVMEALSRAGLRTVLFLRPPTAAQLGAFPKLRAFGVAGGSRMMSPAEMERELPPAFDALKASGAPIIHYKICSTFDSSPQIGSIGRAIEISRRVFGDRPTPLIVGAPVLGRYVVFGNLFARSGLDTDPFRLDRHPTMSRHPVTPMDEADLRLILARQTSLPVKLLDLLNLEAGGGSWSAGRGESPAPILLFDTVREAHLAVMGREMARLAAEGQLFVVGSSGVEYALVAHWNLRSGTARARTREQVPPIASASSRRRRSSAAAALGGSGAGPLVCVSGSCSPVTDRQITEALAHGFTEIALDASQLIRHDSAGVTHSARLTKTDRVPPRSSGVILHTSRGPADARMLRGRKSLATVSARLGPALGRVLEEWLEATQARRAVVCGGDTSMQVARALGIVALEYLCPIAPGCPLCRVHAPGRVADGREIAFKGGQVGRDNFFWDALGATPDPESPD